MYSAVVRKLTLTHTSDLIYLITENVKNNIKTFMLLNSLEGFDPLGLEHCNLSHSYISYFIGKY